MNDKGKVKMCPLASRGQEQHRCTAQWCAWWIDGVDECAMVVMARNMIINVKMLEQDLFAGEFDEIDEEDHPF